MRIIPAIDVIDGKCVRLTQGDYTTKKIYNEDPCEMAKRFQDYGINYLHLVDLEGAINKHIVNYKTLEKICAKTTLKVDFGGGIKTNQDVRIAFECGANQITGGSTAVNNPEMFNSWLTKYGSSKIILGADCNARQIATSGWTKSSKLDVVKFIKDYQNKGVNYVICTDIAKDGMLKGTSNKLYKEIIEQTNTSLIASGGVSSVSDLIKLEEIGCEGAIIGKAIYEGKIKLKELIKLC